MRTRLSMMMTTKMKTLSSSTLLLRTTLLTLAVAVGLCGGSVSRCPENHYRGGGGRGHGRCQACSTCPINQIIRRPCTEDSNTLCGPFSEFLEFHQAPRTPSLGVGDLPLLGDDDHDVDNNNGDATAAEEEAGVGRGLLGPDLGAGGDTRGSDDNRSKKPNPEAPRYPFPGGPGDEAAGGQAGGGGGPQQTPHPKHHRGGNNHAAEGKWHNHQRHHQNTDKARFQASSYDPAAAVPGRRGPPSPPVPAAGGPEERVPEAPSLRDPAAAEDGSQNQWKVLALALIVVLCVVCIFLIVFVFVICYLRSRRAHLKQVVCSSASSSADTPTNRIRGGQSRPPYGGHSLHYVPVLTTHARQARAGTSGAAMPSPTAPPGGMVVDSSSYLYSEDYDADNSGQTISTAKSSDYVYFKSPHNGNDVYDV